MRIGGCGKVLAQSLCAWLTDMERGTDGAYRGNTISREVSREHPCGLLCKRIDRTRHLRASRDRRHPHPE